MTSLKNKKVLVMGLGRLQGGVATTKWLVRRGADVTVTDLKTKKELAGSIKVLGAAAKKVWFVLGRHDEKDFQAHDFVVVNPGVPRESKYLKIARQNNPSTSSGNNKVRIVNDAVLFFEYLPKENPIIAITGTKGKTTTTNFVAHLLKSRWPHARAAGNTPENPLLKELERLKKYPGTPAVLELSSWQLEYLPEARRAPDIAVITNLYPDHMNRYASMREYAVAKENIFKNQTSAQFFIDGRRASIEVQPRYISYTQALGAHNVSNFSLALSAARLASKHFPPKKPLTEKEIGFCVRTLSSALPRFRQEIVYNKNGLCVINDSASTSPEAGIAALQRFSVVAHAKRLPFFFITGGTDKGLSYRKLAAAIQTTSKLFVSWKLPFQVYLLEGSATNKMFKDLHMTICKDLPISIFKDLEAIVRAAKEKISSPSTPPRQARGRSGDKKGIVVFSPSAASFEKFKNEFDRGGKFNSLVQKYFMV